MLTNSVTRWNTSQQLYRIHERRKSAKLPFLYANLLTLKCLAQGARVHRPTVRGASAIGETTWRFVACSDSVESCAIGETAWRWPQPSVQQLVAYRQSCLAKEDGEGTEATSLVLPPEAKEAEQEKQYYQNHNASSSHKDNH